MARPLGPVISRRFRTPHEVFGFGLTDLRIERGLSQSELAAALGYSTFYLGRIERGEANITCDVMAAIAKFFGMSIGELWLYAEGRQPKRKAVSGRTTK